MHVHPWILIQTAGLARAWTLTPLAVPGRPEAPPRYKLTSPDGSLAIWYLDAEAPRVAVTREGGMAGYAPVFLSFEDGLRVAEGRLVFGEAVADPVAPDPSVQRRPDPESPTVSSYATAGV
jgi:hypothetical protein